MNWQELYRLKFCLYRLKFCQTDLYKNEACDSPEGRGLSYCYSRIIIGRKLSFLDNIFAFYLLVNTFICGHDTVYKHLPEKFYLQDGSTQRGDLRANIFRKIIANLCVHREYASNEVGLFEIFADKVRTCNATKFTSSLRTGSISIDELENYTKNPLLFKVFRELGWGEELGSGSRNIKKFAPLYYNNSVIEILNNERFVFSMTYRDVVGDVQASDVNRCENVLAMSVKSCEVDSAVDHNNVNVDKLTSISIATALVSEFVSGVSDKIALRMAEEIAAIYVVGQLTKKELKEQLELTEEQIKIDLRELSRAKLLEQRGKDKKYMLSEMAQIKISSFWTKM